MNKCILLAQLDTGKRLLSEFRSNVLIGILQESYMRGLHRGKLLSSGPPSALRRGTTALRQSLSPGTPLTTLPSTYPVFLQPTRIQQPRILSTASLWALPAP